MSKDFGSQIRRAREAAGLSQLELAQALGYSSPATISHFENGERTLSVRDLLRIASLLGVSPASLLGDSNDTSAKFAMRASQIAPSSREAVAAFLSFADKHGSTPPKLPQDFRKKKPREVVRNLLSSSKTSRPPIDPAQVAEHLGVPVFQWEFDQDISGIVVDGERVAIGVNNSQHHLRQRFTTAHEIGHLIYGLGNSEIIFDFFSRERGFAFDSTADPEAEIRANHFAAELLMPTKWIYRDAENQDVDVRVLASKYAVSEQAMWFRLLNLKLANTSFPTPS